MLIEKIQNRQSGIVLYGMVPPKKGNDADKVAAIAARQVERLRDLPLDGLVLYDLQDEKARIAEERPFPFMETLDPYEYSRDYLAEIAVPKVIYRAVGKYSKPQLTSFLTQLQPQRDLTVFVGAASQDQQVQMTVNEAYELRAGLANPPLLGGVTIPERHLSKGDEHQRVFAKMAKGCSFFISQGVYDVNASKNFLSDYYYSGRQQGIEPVPVIFTLTPCGSVKTLQFMKWLGISIPRWLENELIHSRDILQQSLDVSEQNWRELKAFADEKNIPIGCNIESVAVRKVEVEASIELLRRVAGQS
ncbi:methylenetetrahydrofolate reductase [Granulosicoccaceae sp. 1_MG-2023]|nr:methylenetetrahydrofolate reductase [Granulosicoccaceae sp. 1_MG-2023]